MEAYLSLFGVALLAATILPTASEVMLSGLAITGYDPFILWTVATIGNTLGSVVNYGVGRFLLRYKDRPNFPFKKEQLKTSQAWFQRYGVWTLLLAWLPLIGDVFTFAAGVMKVKFPIFLLLVFIGKGARYAFLLVVVLFFTGG